MGKEFKAFILRGNALNMAVGVIIGAAFQGIVRSLTDDLINPILGLFGRVDFSQFVITINQVDIRIGAFISAVINFLIMAVVIFFIVKAANRLIEPKPAVPSAPTIKPCPFCATDIPLGATRCPHCTSTLD